MNRSLNQQVHTHRLAGGGAIVPQTIAAESGDSAAIVNQ
jgi:hypothetical protein